MTLTAGRVLLQRIAAERIGDSADGREGRRRYVSRTFRIAFLLPIGRDVHRFQKHGNIDMRPLVQEYERHDEIFP
ncbi:hypothetical protein Q4F19_06600 [Sphingomonas sp. BIUV-7]|uniref:Uncharacterized protein n=1 Tax=Sphingomonas natans TaxID=3063330 RepID=A0ABT8Y8N5_9SPHN|nr:hypothetical protein [Sphingomonas sp. BIUV-7]